MKSIVIYLGGMTTAPITGEVVQARQRTQPLFEELNRLKALGIGSITGQSTSRFETFFCKDCMLWLQKLIAELCFKRQFHTSLTFSRAGTGLVSIPLRALLMPKTNQDQASLTQSKQVNTSQLATCERDGASLSPEIESWEFSHHECQ